MRFFFKSLVVHRGLHSFPTRRSSDLLVKKVANRRLPYGSISRHMEPPGLVRACTSKKKRSPAARSEEHTSELQSLRHFVFSGVPEDRSVADDSAPRRKA